MGATESTRPEGSSKSEDGDTVANEESANNVQDGESIDAKVKKLIIADWCINN